MKKLIAVLILGFSMMAEAETPEEHRKAVEKEGRRIDILFTRLEKQYPFSYEPKVIERMQKILADKEARHDESPITDEETAILFKQSHENGEAWLCFQRPASVPGRCTLADMTN